MSSTVRSSKSASARITSSGRTASRMAGRSSTDSPEQRQIELARRSDRSDDLVPDAAARGRELAVEPPEALACPDEDDPTAAPDDLEQLESGRFVGGAQQADRERTRDDRGRDQAGRREVVVRAEPEREHDQRDEHERRDDPPRPRPPLAHRVQARLVEDEHGDGREEGQPLGGARRPEERPEDVVAVDERSDHERRHQAECQTRDVERDEHSDAEQPATHLSPASDG